MNVGIVSLLLIPLLIPFPPNMSTEYNGWKIVDWDGNPALKLKCWRKKFGRGHVSVGIGDFKNVVYSYGANSDFSLSGTRARGHYGLPDQTEYAAMDMVDRFDGHHNHKDTE